jgi:hypothetical protein
VAKIAGLKVLDEVLKKSFSNVRMDIISIKDYLEKQHDIHNKEVSDLQGQVISLRKELFERTRELSEYAKADEIERLEKESKELDNKLSEYDVMLTRIQRGSTLEVEKRRAELLRENQNLRSEFYKELGDIDRKFRDTKLKIVEEQSKLMEQKTARLEKSLGEVELLKKELRIIVRQARTKGVPEERIKRLEPKLAERSFFSKAKEAVADFFFEEPLIEPEEELYEVKAEKKARRKKEERKETPGWLIWLIPLLLLLLIIGFGLYYFSGDIAKGFAGLAAGFSNLIAPPQQPEVGVENVTLAKGPVISVYEGDFVDIVPNMSDADNDRLTYSFTKPLNSSGQWKTLTGDAGTYPITVTVSDGEKESTLNFTLVVKEKVK